MNIFERDLLAKARRGEVTTDDKLSVIETLTDLEWFRLGLVLHGLDTPEALGAVARRKVAMQRPGAKG